MSSKHLCVVFIRHGHSEWNLSNRFTGWTDISLTDIGLNEAASAGRILAANGFQFDEAHASVLQRTQQTIQILLQAANHAEIPLYTSWRLNERHYGQLQGMNKTDIEVAWGEKESRKWWRGYYEAPPAVDEEDERHPRFDPLYKDVLPEQLPRSESLADCQRRLLPYWLDVLVPAIVAGRRLVVSSHGNALRALIMHLEDLDPLAIETIEIEPGVPLLCWFDHDMRFLNREWLV